MKSSIVIQSLWTTSTWALPLLNSKVVELLWRCLTGEGKDKDFTVSYVSVKMILSVSEGRVTDESSKTMMSLATSTDHTQSHLLPVH